MFNKEKTTQSERFAPINATLISPGTILTGDVTSDNDLRIDGHIIGNVTSTAKIIIGATGYVEGNVTGQHADITGRVLGNLTIADLLQLRGSSDIKGNISAGKLQIDPLATFNGQCQMNNTGSIVQMSTHELQSEIQ
ncbi:MAG: polymer-forming cytoskeletal protein [Chitinophagaceae bacterium]